MGKARWTVVASASGGGPISVLGALCHDDDAVTRARAIGRMPPSPLVLLAERAVLACAGLLNRGDVGNA